MLRPFQAEALDRLRSTEIHLSLVAPTGSGKGRILEVLSSDPRERVLVLTPLLALARQQRSRFRSAGVPDDRVRILSPESALLRSDSIRRWKPTLVAVDEAHCVHEWGERFRPAYGRLLGFLRDLGCRRSLWMSATFPRSLLDGIREALPGPWTVQGSFSFPPGLRSEFRRTSPADRVERIRSETLGRTGPGILFVGTRKDVGRYLSVLPDRPFLAYHAGMGDEERRSVESTLGREAGGDARISVVATNAFGMGMDFPQFEWVSLASAPYSLLGLLQSFGRVARSGRSGEAVVYWAEEDFRFSGLLLSGNERAESELSILRRYLEAREEERPAITGRVFV